MRFEELPVALGKVLAADDPKVAARVVLAIDDEWGATAGVSGASELTEAVVFELGRHRFALDYVGDGRKETAIRGRRGCLVGKASERAIDARGVHEATDFVWTAAAVAIVVYGVS